MQVETAMQMPVTNGVLLSTIPVGDTFIPADGFVRMMLDATNIATLGTNDAAVVRLDNGKVEDYPKTMVVIHAAYKAVAV